MTIAGDLTQHPLTHVRNLRGWTLSDVAAIVARRSGLNMAQRREKVWRWEHRNAIPEQAAQLALAAELSIDPVHVEAKPWPAWLLLVDPTEPTEALWTPQASHTILSQVLESAAMDRRSFLILGGTAMANLTTTWSTQLPDMLQHGIDGARIGHKTITALENRIEELWYLDDLLGGGSCMDAGLADLRLVSQLLRKASYSDATRQHLWSVAASLARFAGWAAFDTGRNAAAQRYWHAALRAAHSAGDTSQGVYILSNLALQAIYTGDGATAVDILTTSRAQVDPASRIVLAMLDTWQARAHALLGETNHTHRLLQQADDLWANRHSEDDPSWVYWMPQPTLTAEAGTALMEIGDYPNAEHSLTEGLGELSADSARDRNLYLIRIADTHLAQGKLEQATASARLAIDTLTEDGGIGLDSHRVDQRIEAFLTQLPAREPVTTELRDYWRTQQATKI